MTLPNFFIIGAAKSGTTSLYHYLKDHPQIFMPQMKEPEYFSFLGQKIDRKDIRMAPGIFAISDAAEYEALFKGANGKPAVGEASPSYIYVPEVAARIKERVPDAKFIAILRDPAERAYSHFNMRKNKTNTHESITDFGEALKAEDDRVRQGWACGWHYKRRGFYYEQLKRYYDLFRKDRILVLMYEDLISNPADVLRRIYKFLSVDENYLPSFEVHNKGTYNAVVKNPLIHKFLAGDNWVKSLLKPFMKRDMRKRLKKSLIALNMEEGDEEGTLDPALRKQLVEEYREDILKLQTLIGRDLSAWLT